MSDGKRGDVDIIFNMFVVLFICLTLTLVIVMIVYIFKILTKPHPVICRHESEKFFVNPGIENKCMPFPRLCDPPSVDLSVIIPAYDEEHRLPSMLDDVLRYLLHRKETDRSFTFEVIVVDDGSHDQTTRVALQYSERYGTNLVRVLTLERNRGKGGAVRLGMFSARGRRLLFADADGASRFGDLGKLEDALLSTVDQDNMAVICGSRAHLEHESIAKRSLFRTVLMKAFHLLVWLLCVRGVKDTQCGFKLFTRPAAEVLFANMHVERWAFDVELLYLANQLHIPVAEVSVSWREVDGSKMVPVLSWLQMGRDLILIGLRYRLGFWKIDPKAS